MSESIGIDDLLRHEEDAPSRRRQRSPGRWAWLRTLLVAAAATAVVVLGLWMSGVALPIPAIFTGCLAMLVLRMVVRQVAAPPATVSRTRVAGSGEEDGHYVFTNQDGLRDAVNRWEKPLRSAQHDANRFTQLVQPAIGELVDERLRQRHGLTRASDPVRARAILGEELWDLLTYPAKRKPTPRDSAVLVGQLEKL